MFKRIRWMSVGAAVGFGGSVWAQRRVRQTVARYLPEQVGSEAFQRVRDLRDDVLDALDEGRDAMRSHEAELRAQLGVPPPSTDTCKPALPGAPTGRRLTGGRAGAAVIDAAIRQQPRRRMTD